MTAKDPNITAAIDGEPVAATLDPAADGYTLTMERQLDHPVDRVWAMLTDPAQLERWSPIVPDRALDSTGPASSRENPDDESVDVEVLEVSAPTLLVHRWGPHRLTWRLTEEGDGTRLRLEHWFAERAEAPRFGAGWHVCFGGLTAALAHQEVGRAVGPLALDYGWEQLHTRYADLLGVPTHAG